MYGKTFPRWDLKYNLFIDTKMDGLKFFEIYVITIIVLTNLWRIIWVKKAYYF